MLQLAPSDLRLHIGRLFHRSHRPALLAILGLVSLIPIAFVLSIPALLAVGVIAGAILTAVAMIRTEDQPSAANHGHDAVYVDVDELLRNHIRPGRRLAILDPRTMMLQRWYFDLRLAEESERCRRHGITTTLLFLKVEHSADPGVIREVAQLLNHRTRAGDLAVQISQDYYGLCLTQTDEMQARTAIRRLLLGSALIEVAKVYVALCPTDGVDLNTLLKNARTVDLFEAATAPAPSEPVRNPQPLSRLLAEAPTGEIALKPDESIAQAKARVRRAAKRAGVPIELTEGDGVLWFERIGDQSVAEAQLVQG